MLALSENAMVPIRNPAFLRETVKEIHSSMLGDHLHNMNKHALNDVALTVNEIKDIQPVSYLFLTVTRHILFTSWSIDMRFSETHLLFACFKSSLKV